MEEPLSRKPVDADFQQQRLRVWTPIQSLGWSIATFSVIGIAFIITGAIILATTSNAVEQNIRYDSSRQALAPNCNQQNQNDTSSCKFSLNVTLTHSMSAPIYVYYELHSFYQNHRRYVKSRSDTQLQAESSPSDLTNCDPLQNGLSGQTAYPCGLIAGSQFNDSFGATLYQSSNPSIPILLGSASDQLSSTSQQTLTNSNWDSSNIVFSVDVQDKYKSYSDSQIQQLGFTRQALSGQILPNVTDPDFQTWMRIASTSSFRKLYRVIRNQDLKSGDILSIDVIDVFPVDAFGGEKHLILATTSWMGTRNNFLGIAYLVVGGICVLLAILALLRYKINPRQKGDLNYFHKNSKNNPSNRQQTKIYSPTDKSSSTGRDAPKGQVGSAMLRAATTTQPLSHPKMSNPSNAKSE